jgi:putative selenate reductase
MRELGVRTLGDYAVKAQGQGAAAVAAVVTPSALRERLLVGLDSPDVDLRGLLREAGEDRLYPELVRRAALLNTPVVVARVNAAARYKAEANRGVPRKIGSRLWLFDCINCDKCVPVCPNDANFVYETGVLDTQAVRYRVEGTTLGELPGARFVVAKAHQIATFQDFCNECGNCDTFCPEDGGPFVEKPRFFGSLDAWRRVARDGFVVLRQDDVDAVWGRIRGVEYHLEVDRVRDRALFTDGAITLELRHSQRRPLHAQARPGAPDGHVLDLAAYLNMALAVDGVLDKRRANPVNAPWL